MSNLHAQSARERDLRAREEQAAKKETEARQNAEEIRALKQAANQRDKEIEAAKGAVIIAQRERDNALKKVDSPSTFRDNLSSGGLGPEMVLIPAGSFWMGSKEGETIDRKEQRPQHVVNIGKPFYVGKYEVTRGQFAQFVRKTGYQSEAEKGQGCSSFDAADNKYTNKGVLNWRTPDFVQTDDHPVVCVSWNDAQAYIVWLNKESGSKAYRLLSEAEWEYAARAELRGIKESKRFPWGDDSEYKEICGYENIRDASLNRVQPKFKAASCEDGYAYTSPVGKKKPNAFGLYDMLGNAAEFVADCWHSNYNDAPLDGSAWMTACTEATYRVLRGGSWSTYHEFVASALRSSDTPVGRDNYVGFRIALSLP